MDRKLSGLVAATFTPMRSDGSLNLTMAKPIVDHLIRTGVKGLYVCGSTGEGALLTGDERRATAKAYVEAAEGRIPVIVQVGHSSIVEAKQLAEHAQQIGADAISAVAPYYFKPSSAAVLADCLAEIAAGAPESPFYYYHIPDLSGVNVDMMALLRDVSAKIPSFAGIKYTTPSIDQLQELHEADGGRYDILFGRDEMLLSSLAVGIRGAVGSTYNFAAPLYNRLIEAFESGNLIEARHCQSQAIAMIRIICGYRFHAGLKAMMGLWGLDCGPNRLPTVALQPHELAAMRAALDSLGFFQWEGMRS